MYKKSIRRGLDPSSDIMVNYAKGLYQKYGVTMENGAAIRSMRQIRIQTLPNTRFKDMTKNQKKKEMADRNKRKTHVTKDEEVDVLWGSEGIDAVKVCQGGVRIVDTHAGSGAISRIGSRILCAAALIAETVMPAWYDVDIKKQNGYSGATARLRVYDTVDPSSRGPIEEIPSNFTFSPAFPCSDLPFIQNATAAAEFSAALLPTNWLRQSVPTHRKELWESLKAAGRTGVVYTDVNRGFPLGQLAWFIVFKSHAVRTHLFRGATYHA
jgi:hypothetical protein